jgi:hypothetical protein
MLAMLYRLWPSCDAPQPWQGVVRQLYGHVPGKQLLWTAAEGGRWLSTQQCLFPDAACMQQDTAEATTRSSDSNQQQEVQVVQPGAGGGLALGDGSCSSGFGPLGKALVQLGLPLAALPGSVLAMMQKHLVRLFRATELGLCHLQCVDRQHRCCHLCIMLPKAYPAHSLMTVTSAIVHVDVICLTA